MRRLPALLYTRLTGDRAHDEHRVREIEKVAGQRGARPVWRLFDRPGENIAWQRMLEELWRRPGPRRVSIAYELSDWGIGARDGRYEFGLRVWRETGGGVFATPNWIGQDESDLDLIARIHQLRLDRGGVSDDGW